MHTISKIAVGALLAVTGVSAQNTTVQCASGLKMFVARGTGEDMGVGETGKLVSVLADQIPGSSIQAIEYPATMDDPLYFASVANGTTLVKRYVTAYAKACPTSKMALFGYSQGAQVMSNSLCGQPAVWAAFGLTASMANATGLMEAVKPLPREVTKNIAYVVLFGDPSHSANASYAYGNSTGGSGVFYRGNISECEALGSRLRSYCDAGDPYCDEGGSAPTSLTAHLTYVIAHGAELAKLIVGQFQGSGSNSSAGSTSPTPTPVVPSAAVGLSSTPLLAAGAMLLVFGLI